MSRSAVLITLLAMLTTVSSCSKATVYGGGPSAPAVNSIINPLSPAPGNGVDQLQLADRIVRDIHGADGIYLNGDGKAVILCISDAAASAVVSAGLIARRATYGLSALKVVDSRILEMQKSGAIRSILSHGPNLEQDRVIVQVASNSEDSDRIAMIGRWPEVKIEWLQAAPLSTIQD